MENEPKIEKTSEELLSEFQQEIAAIKKQGDESGKSGDFSEKIYGEYLGIKVSFEPKELTQEDMRLYEKIKNKSIQMEDITAYRKEITKEGVSQSRKIFAGFIGNKAGAIFMEKELKEMEENEK